MKKYLVILALSLSLVLTAVACSNGETPATSPSKSIDTGSSVNTGLSADTGSSIDTESSIDTGSSIDTESSIDTGSSVDTETSIDTGSSVDTESSVDTQSSTTDILPPDENDPAEPEVEDMPIDIAVNGISDYVVVYEDSDPNVCEFTTKLVEYMKDTHNITLSVAPDSVGTDSAHCIYIGNIDGASRTKARLNSGNDFGACVSGDDYVLYATNSRLYNYLYEILTSEVLITIRNGNWSTQPKKNFIYHSSKHKDVSYVDYVLDKNGGVLTQEILLSFFEPHSFVAADGTELVYRFYAPYDYDSGKEYPLLTVLHGAGERGNNNTGNMHHMMLNLFSLENSPLWESIVICPQCPDGQQWVDTPWAEGEYSIDEVPESNELKAVVEIIDMVEAGYPTDTDRYYVTGLSMGGFGAWDLIMRHTDRFAAAVPICGGADYEQAENLINKPIYTLHDKNDSTVPSRGTKLIVVALQALGSTTIQYEELSGYGHNVWSYASSKAEIWTWLFEQSLN